MYHYTFGGLRNVWLANGYKTKETPDGDAVAFADGAALELAICDALARKAGKLTGAELRFVRQSGLGLSQAALGKMFGVDAQSIARWEKNSRVPQWADKLIRLVFRAKQNGNEPIKNAIERLNVVERLVREKIVLRERSGQWKPSIEEIDAPETAPA